MAAPSPYAIFMPFSPYERHTDRDVKEEVTWQSIFAG